MYQGVIDVDVLKDIDWELMEEHAKVIDYKNFHKKFDDLFIFLDIDECESGNICPKGTDICWNIRGSYRCNSIQCPHNYIREPDQKK